MALNPNVDRFETSTKLHTIEAFSCFDLDDNCI